MEMIFKQKLLWDAIKAVPCNIKVETIEMLTKSIDER